jgi:hypothetical protein
MTATITNAFQKLAKMPFCALTGILSFTLFAFSCASSHQTPNNASMLVGTWQHSFEEDRGKAGKEPISAWRREDYPFPPARGRAAFKFEPGGRFVWMPIAAGDGNGVQPGKWIKKSETQYNVEITDGKAYLFKFTEIGPDQLFGNLEEVSTSK